MRVEGNGATKNWAVLIFSIFLTLCSIQDGHAVEHSIVVLVGSDIESYRQAAEGAQKGLQGLRAVILPVHPDLQQLKYAMEKVSLMAPQVIIAIGSEAALAAKITSLPVPVIFCLVVDHHEWLRVPNSWAVSMHLSPEDMFNRIRQALPNRRIAIPYNPERTGSIIKDMTGHFSKKNIELVPIVVQKPSELGPAMAKARGDYDALWIIPDPSFVDPLSVRYIIEYSIEEHLPIIGHSEAFTKNGAVLSLAGNYEDMGQQAAEMAFQVASGRNPPRLVYPRKIRTYVNVRVARILNLRITETFIAQADRIYPLDPARRMR
jgi:putative tryptophan/tyrosine transport system substrate-binding protein